MEPHAIEAAYDPFVTELLAGGFVTPEDGWSAALVAAHVAINNDLIAAAAESIAAGDSASFDNGDAVDDAQLCAHVDRAGDRDGLAAALTTSARRLAAALQALDQTTAMTDLAVRIADARTVVRDEPMPVGALIEGNATFHLDSHLEQLRALRL